MSKRVRSANASRSWRSSADGMCGIRIEPGRRIGLFLSMRAGKGRWWTELCSTADPDVLIAAAALPAPSGTARSVAAVAGRTLDVTALTARGNRRELQRTGRQATGRRGLGTAHALAVRRPMGDRAGTSDRLGSVGIDQVPLTTVHGPALRGRRQNAWAAGERDGRPMVARGPGAATASRTSTAARPEPR